MADAPERIWVEPKQIGDFWSVGTQMCDLPFAHMTEYVRADLTPPASVVEAMEKALRPFAFFNEDNPDEDIQTAWETRYGDRFRDWIDFDDIEAVRAALAALTAWRDAQ